MLSSMPTLVTLLVALAALGTSGCAHPPAPRATRGADLAESAQTFTEALRWQRYRHCGRLVAPEIASSFQALVTEAGDDLRITDGEVLTIDWPEDSEAAKVVVRLRFLKLPSIVERTTTLEQRWEARRDRGWLLARMESTDGPGPFDVL